MTVLDWGLLVIWLGVALCGFWKGAVRIVFGVGGAVAGIWFATVAGADVALALEEHISPPWLATVLGHGVPVLLCLGLCFAAGWGIERTLKAMKLGWLNRLGGAVLAGFAAALLLAVIVVAAARFSPAWAELCRRSLLTPYLLQLLEYLVPPEAAPPAPAGP
jgi:membrane protein required for colicin V production